MVERVTELGRLRATEMQAFLFFRKLLYVNMPSGKKKVSYFYAF